MLRAVLLEISAEDHAGFERARDWLLEGFSAWLCDHHGSDADEAADIASSADSMLGWKFSYEDGHLGRWTAGDITEFLLRWCPRKLSVPAEECADIPGDIAAFTDYLAARKLLAPGSASAAVLRSAAVNAT